MAYRISTREVIVEVDTEPELRVVLTLLGVVGVQIPLPLEGRALNGHSEGLGEVIRSLNGRGRQLLEYLVPLDWVQDKQLCAAIGLTNNNSLAGIWTPIIRRAKGHGLDPAQIFQKQRRRGKGEEAGYWYRLTPEAKVALIPR